jgi:hypothetical protein
MADILANPVKICFGSFTATPTVLAVTTSLVTTVKIVMAPAAAPVSDLASEIHLPKPYNIIQGMERVIDMMEETLQICKRSLALNANGIAPQDLPLRSVTTSDIYAHQATRSPQIHLGGGSHVATLSPSSTYTVIRWTYRAPITRVHDTPSAAADCGRRLTRSILLPVPRELPRLRTVASF